MLGLALENMVTVPRHAPNRHQLYCVQAKKNTYIKFSLILASSQNTLAANITVQADPIFTPLRVDAT